MHRRHDHVLIDASSAKTVEEMKIETIWIT